MKIFHKKSILTLALTAILTASAYSAETPPANHFLAAPVYSVTHFDPAQTGVFPFTVHRGTFHVDLDKAPSVNGGPVNIQTFASTSPDHMWGISSNGITYIDIRGGDFKTVAKFTPSYVHYITHEKIQHLLHQQHKTEDSVRKAVEETFGADAERRLRSGASSLVDKENVVYTTFFDPNTKKSILYAVTLKDPQKPEEGLEVKRMYDLSKIHPADSHENGFQMNLTYDGRLILTSANILAVMERSFEGNPHIYTMEKQESVTNGVAVDHKNGIYVVSDHKMRKLVWTGTKISDDEKDGAWTSDYELGTAAALPRSGHGSGSTPVLMGFAEGEDKLVLITDGANRVNLVAFWRDAIPEDFTQKHGTKSRRVADQFPLTMGLPRETERIHSAQPVVVYKNGAFIANNISGGKETKNRVENMLLTGPVHPAPVGVEKVEWDSKTKSFHRRWTRNDIVSNSMAPAMSYGSNLVFTSGYYKEIGWEVVGLDWETGKTEFRTVFGKNGFGNGGYGTLQFMKNGDLLFNSIGGPRRVNPEKMNEKHETEKEVAED